jgi:hypothetical protein
MGGPMKPNAQKKDHFWMRWCCPVTHTDHSKKVAIDKVGERSIKEYVITAVAIILETIFYLLQQRIYQSRAIPISIRLYILIFIHYRASPTQIVPI